MNNSRPFSGTIESTAVTIEAPGEFDTVTFHFDDGAATTGTVTITNTPPGMTEAKTYTDNVYSVGDSGSKILNDADLGTLTLTPASLDAALTYRVKFTDK